MKHSIFCLSLVLAATCVNGVAHAQSGYRIAKSFKVASPGGWDYPAVNMGKLYLSHGSQVNILDNNTGDSLGYIPNTTGVHGIAFANAFGKGYTSNGRLNNVTVFDLKTNQILGQVATGANPDWIMYDEFSKKIITSNHTAGTLTVIDPASDKAVATINIVGKLETVASDHAGKLFVNAEDKSEIVVVDIVKNEVIAHWSLAPGEGPTGLAIDRKTKRLFAACDKLLVVMDATNGRIVDKLPIGDGSDGDAFDPSTNLIFTSNGEGTLTVIREISADKYQVVENVPTKRGARTIALDEKTHRVYLPTADYEPVQSDAPKNARPKMIPGSFQVLVLEKKG